MYQSDVWKCSSSVQVCTGIESAKLKIIPNFAHLCRRAKDMSQVIKNLKIRTSPGLGYRLLRAYADPAFLASYSSVQFVGLENIPENCAVIVAPNHTNGLMDPLAAMSLGRFQLSDGRKGKIAPMIFAARADMFRIPGLRELLLSLYVTPVMRIRDGFSHLGENAAIMDEVSDRLCDGIPYCIMAEGTQRDKRSLLPLLKGIFRVALQTDDKLSGKVPVVILPVGIGYGSFYRYRSTLLVNVGKPLDVSEFRRSHPELTQPELMNLLRSELTGRMKSLFLCIDDDPDYEAVLEICHIVSEYRLLSSSADGGFSLYDRMLSDKEAVDSLYALRDSADAAEHEKYSSLVRLGVEAAELRKKLHVSASSYSGLHRPLFAGQFMRRKDMAGKDVRCGLKRVPESLRAFELALTFPYWIFSVAVTSPILLIVEILCKVQEDMAFLVSLRYAVAAFTLPLLWVVYAALLAVFMPKGLWWVSVLLLLLFIPAYTFAHDWFKALRLLVSDRRFSRSRRLSSLAVEVRSAFSNRS